MLYMIQYDSIWFNMIKYDSIWFNMIKYDSIWFNMMMLYDDAMDGFVMVCQFLQRLFGNWLIWLGVNCLPSELLRWCQWGPNHHGFFWTLREDKSDLWITVLKITQNHPTTLTAFLAVQNVKKTLEFFGCGIAVSPPTAFQRHNSKAKSEIWLDRDHVTIVHLAQALCRKGLLQTKVGSCLARFR